MATSLSKRKALERIFVYQAVEEGFLTQEQLKECIDEHEKCDPPVPLLTICKRKGYLNKAQVNHLMSKRLDTSVARAFSEGLSQRECEVKKEKPSLVLEESVEISKISYLQEEERKEFERLIEEKDKLLEKEQKQKEFLKKKLEEYKLSLEEKDKVISTLESEVLCYKGLSEQYQEKINNLEKALEEKEILLERERQKSQGLFKLLDESGKELRTSEEERLKLETELEKKTKELEFLQNKLEKEKKEKDELKKDIEEYKENYNKLKEEIDKLTKEKEEIDKLKNKLDEFKNENSKLKKLLEEIKKDKDISTIELQKKELERKSKEHTKLLTQLKEKDEFYKEKIEKLENEKREIEEKYNKDKEEFKNKIKELKEEIKKYKEEKSKIEDEFHQLKISLESEIKKYKQKSESLEAQLNKYQETLKGWNELEREKDELKKKVEEERKQREKLEKEKDELKSQIKDLEEKLTYYQQPPSGELESGTILPGSDKEYYVIQKMLGRGGMGITYSAVRGSDDTIVVVKTLLPEAMNDMKVVMRFIQEARTIMGFDHPNLVKGFDVQQGKNLSFFVMEYLDGDSVEDILEEEGILDPIRATEIILGIARALEYLEKHHLVHRDVKPANIIVNSDGTPKLVDFGIVKMTDRKCSLTTEGIILGTPYYLSPEQISETSVDIRSDIYSLGATYYHMVVGDVPFPGDNPIDVIQQRLIKTPRPGKVKPNLPKPICNIIEKMMSRHIKKRHKTASDLVKEMEKVLNKIKK